MLFWKEHKDDTEYMYCDKSRYVKVINEDGVSVTTKMTVKQHRYIPIMLKLKRLFLCEETTQQMRWHKEGIYDSEETDIMLHLVNVEEYRGHVAMMRGGQYIRRLFVTEEYMPIYSLVTRNRRICSYISRYRGI
jgi:hypothetical protein